MKMRFSKDEASHAIYCTKEYNTILQYRNKFKSKNSKCPKYATNCDSYDI